MAGKSNAVHRPAGIETIATLPAKADAIAVALFEKTAALPSHMKTIDAAADGALVTRHSARRFQSEGCAVTSVALAGGIKRLLVVGLGKPKISTSINFGGPRRPSPRRPPARRWRRSLLYLHGELPEETPPAIVGQAIAEGITLASFKYDEFKKSMNGEEGADHKKKVPPTIFSFYEPGKAHHAETAQGLAEGAIIGDAANYTRLLSCKPGNVIHPQSLVAEAIGFARREKLKATIIDEKKATALGMGGLVSVGQGSNSAPALIVLEYARTGRREAQADRGGRKSRHLRHRRHFHQARRRYGRHEIR